MCFVLEGGGVTVGGGMQAWLYDLRTRHLVDDLPAIAKLVEGANSVLEVGCGTGRVLSYLARQRPGVRWIGVEQDAAKLAVFRRKHESTGLSNIELWEGDFLNCPALGPLDVVLFPFNVLAEFTGVAGRIAALRQAKRLLSKEGKVVVVCWTHDFADWGERSKQYTTSIEDIDLGRWEVTLDCVRDAAEQVSRCTVVYQREEESVRDTYEVALLTRNELLATYEAAGLVVDQEFGDYQFGPLTEKSSVWIHLLKIRVPSPGHAQRGSGHGRGG